jgi:hypothetical protein
MLYGPATNQIKNKDIRYTNTLMQENKAIQHTFHARINRTNKNKDKTIFNKTFSFIMSQRSNYLIGEALFKTK